MAFGICRKLQSTREVLDDERATVQVTPLKMVLPEEVNDFRENSPVPVTFELSSAELTQGEAAPGADALHRGCLRGVGGNLVERSQDRIVPVCQASACLQQRVTGGDSQRVDRHVVRIQTELSLSLHQGKLMVRIQEFEFADANVSVIPVRIPRVAIISEKSSAEKSRGMRRWFHRNQPSSSCSRSIDRSNSAWTAF